MIKIYLFLLLFSVNSFAEFIIHEVQIECAIEDRCEKTKNAFKSLARSFEDKAHFKNIIKVYSLTTGVESFRYKVETRNSQNILAIKWTPKKIINEIVYIFKGEELSIPSVLPVKEDDFFDSNKVSKTIRVLKELYSSQGYPHAKILSQIKGSGSHIDLNFLIDLGKPILVQEIKVNTRSDFLKKTVSQKLYHFKNSPFNPQDIRKEVDELKNLFYEFGYYLHRISLKLDESNGSVNIFITIENETIHAFEVNYKNQDHYALDLKNLIRENTIVSKRELSLKAISEIVKNDLEEKGYLNSKYKVKRQELLNKNKEKYIVVSVNITRNQKSKIKSINFKGNNEITSKKLLELFYEKSTSQASNDVIDTKYYKAFLSVIKEEYIKRGFVNVFLESPEIVFDKEESLIDLTYRIRERVRAKVDKVIIQGVSKNIKQSLLEILKMKNGDPFNPILFKRKIGELKKYIRNEGYYFSELVSEKVNKLISYNSDNTKVTINLEFALDKKYTVGDVIIIGNYKTRSKVINRELLFRKKDILKSSQILGSQTRILSTGLFSSVTITPVKNSSSQADILVTVKEKDYGLIEIAPGIRTDLGPKISTNISYNNIDGLHKQLTFKGQVNSRINLNSLDEDRRKNEKNLLEYLALVNYSENYLLDFPLNFASSISTSRQRFFSFDADIQKINYTLSTDVTPWMNVSLTQELETISQYNASIEREDGHFQIGSFTPAVTFDFRNNRINPTSGTFFSLSTEFANPAFWSQSDDEIVIDYYKLISRNRFYIPFKNGVFALSVAGGVQKNLARASVSNSDGSTRTEGFIPNIKVFRLSGMDNVRGFEDDEINRVISGEDISDVRVDNKAYMFNLKIEPRMFLTDSAMLGIFYDAGRIFVDDYDFGKLRSSVGLSFKYLTPVGSLDFDYGIKLLRKKDLDGTLESPGRLHVSIGFF